MARQWPGFMGLTVALALGCSVDAGVSGSPSSRPRGTATQAPAGKTPTPVPTATATSSPGVTPSATPTGTGSSDEVEGGVSKASPSPSGDVVAPTTRPVATPTPFGKVSEPFASGGSVKGMGFLANTLSAWILGSGGLYAVDDDGARRWTYTGNPAKAVAIAGDGPLQMWLARSEAPEIERMTFGSGKLSPAATYSVTGNPVAIAARDGEAWAAAADGTLTKAGGSAVAAGMDLAAIAVGPDAVWGIGSAAKLVRVPRSGGSPVQIDVGTEPRGLAIDADGAAWVACRASVTVASGSQVVKTAALASVPTGIVTSARHVCIGSANRLAFYNLDGTPAGNFTLPFEPQFLGTDSLDRVWACNALLGECVTVWGR